jgi:FkbM family methyltransferase
MLNEFRQLIYKSLVLDINFFSLSPIPIIDKLQFIYTKYKVLVKHLFIPFNFGQTKTTLFGKDLYYNFGRVGLVTMQRILTYHAYLLNSMEIRNPQIIIDIGANVGFFSIFCSRNFPQAHIYAFEPIKQTYAVLCKNIQLDSNVSAFNKAISSQNQQLRMSYDLNNSEISHISANGNESVESETLDSFIEINNIRTIDLLKVDAEEHELQVLLGSTKALGITKYLYIEVNLENNSNYSFSQLIALLYTQQYNFQLINIHSHSSRQLGIATTIECLFKNKNI